MYFTDSPVLPKHKLSVMAFKSSPSWLISTFPTILHLVAYTPAELNSLQHSHCPGEPYDFILLSFRYRARSGTLLHNPEHDLQPLPDSPLKWSPPHPSPLSDPLHKWSLLSLNYHSIWHMETCAHEDFPKRGGREDDEQDASLLAWSPLPFFLL